MQNARTVFISDAHLGSRHCKSELLLDFLTRLKTSGPPDRLYIVGDFIDGWKLKRKWYWDERSSLVICALLDLMRQGTEIFYAAGNHDEFLRPFLREYGIERFGSIHFGDRFVHETADGRRLLVIHGDQFDFATRNARWLCLLGDVGYELLLGMNSFIHAVQRICGLRYWSLSRSVKYNVKRAVQYINDFESLLVRFGREQGCDGCVCGHIHHPEMRWHDDFLYCNTGDWVESCTAIVERPNGSLHVVEFGDQASSVVDVPAIAGPVATSPVIDAPSIETGVRPPIESSATQRGAIEDVRAA